MLAARQVVAAHYVWVARSEQRKARIAEASALAEIGGAMPPSAPGEADLAPEPGALASDPAPALWRASFAHCLQRSVASLRARLLSAIFGRCDSPVSPDAHLRDSPIVLPFLRE